MEFGMSLKAPDVTQHEVARILDQLKRSFEGNAWHGPALMELLRAVPVDVAPAKPLEHAHSIWEIVLHIMAWQEATRERLSGKVVTLTHEQDWPTVSDCSEAAWKQALSQLQLSYEGLHAAIAAISDARLAEHTLGEKYDVYTYLHGVIQHNLYHAGQIAVLRKSSR
jgi:uncharacterized damage-inducible protein DinB